MIYQKVTLLGQNVNSYRDTTEYEFYKSQGIGGGLSNEGFKTIYKRKEGGIRFTELLDHVSQVDPEVLALLIIFFPSFFLNELNINIKFCLNYI